MWGKKYPIDETVLLARLDRYTICEYTGREKNVFSEGKGDSALAT